MIVLVCVVIMTWSVEAIDRDFVRNCSHTARTAPLPHEIRNEALYTNKHSGFHHDPVKQSSSAHHEVTTNETESRAPCWRPDDPSELAAKRRVSCSVEHHSRAPKIDRKTYCAVLHGEVSGFATACVICEWV